MLVRGHKAATSLPAFYEKASLVKRAAVVSSSTSAAAPSKVQHTARTSRSIRARNSGGRSRPGKRCKFVYYLGFGSVLYGVDGTVPSLNG